MTAKERRDELKFCLLCAILGLRGVARGSGDAAKLSQEHVYAIRGAQTLALAAERALAKVLKQVEAER